MALMTQRERDANAEELEVRLTAHEIGTVIRAMNMSVDLITPALHDAYQSAMFKLIAVRLTARTSLERKLGVPR